MSFTAVNNYYKWEIQPDQSTYCSDQAINLHFLINIIDGDVLATECR